MRRLALVLLFAFVPPLFAADAWQIDPRHAKAEFTIRHMMVSNVSGSFTRLFGTISGDPATGEKASVEATIDVGSISTGEPDRDQHLRSKDFFDVARFPTITFRSTNVARGEGKRWRVTGLLTLHGVSKEVTLEVEPLAGPVHDLWDNDRIGITARTTIHRKDFGIEWNRALDGGGVVLADDVAVTLSLEVFRPRA